MPNPEEKVPLFSGEALIHRLNADDSDAWMFGPIYMDVWGAQANSERKDATVKARANRGKVIASTVVGAASSVQVTLRNCPTHILADALGASIADFAFSAASVSSEAVTAPEPGQWKKLAQKHITAATVVVTGTGGTPTYTEGTDYEINYRIGAIRPIIGGAISAAAALEVDYDHTAPTGKTLTIGADQRRDIADDAFRDRENFTV